MLSDKQKEIITGSLLGDGTIWTNHTPGCINKFYLSQSKFDHCGTDKKSYLCWYVAEFLDFGCSVRPRRVNPGGLIESISGPKEYDQYIFTTRCHSMWNDMADKWYVPINHPHFKRKKVIPDDIRLTPLTFCIWYMEDGSNYAKDANITIETQCFTEQEVEILIEKLQSDLGIKANKKRTKKKDQFRIYIGKKSYFEAIEIAKNQVQWDCFKYKLDTSAYVKKPHRGSNHSNSKLTEEKVREAFSLRETGMFHKDIAKKLGVSQPTITMLLNGKRWKHLQV
jgi:hypothetical protein